MDKVAEQKRELFHAWSNLEDKLIEGISETGNQDLMDTFLDWQNKRQLLNKEWNDFIESLKSIESKPTLLTKEYIQFVEWTKTSDQLRFHFHPDGRLYWMRKYEGEIYTTQQLFDYFMEEIYKK